MGSPHCQKDNEIIIILQSNVASCIVLFNNEFFNDFLLSRRQTDPSSSANESKLPWIPSGLNLQANTGAGV